MTAFVGGLLVGMVFGAVGALFMLALCAAAHRGDERPRPLPQKAKVTR